ncbi:MAG: MBL fold metallo-hydrolase [Acidaminococcaceae bacterium]|nr:MBL fold metallo-hydrolase [Acidaminococcaceae bacterium]MBP8742556.1 MBL fold metallo-hydrolase [Acidaminococcaceae bacterium]
MKIIAMEVGVIGTNCYVVINEEQKKGVVIDPGGDADQILEKIKQKGITIEAIFLTHGHSDHIMAVDEVREVTGAKVYISEADADMLTKASSNLSVYMGAGREFKAADEFLIDGETITAAGLKFQVVATPGHTKGGICLLCGDTVFCGDTIFSESIGRTDLPGGSYSQILHSIKTKIMVLPDEMKLLPGHGPATTIGWERRRNPFLQ